MEKFNEEECMKALMSRTGYTRNVNKNKLKESEVLHKLDIEYDEENNNSNL